jgi:hypothetical protein
MSVVPGVTGVTTFKKRREPEKNKNKYFVKSLPLHLHSLLI